MNKKMVQKIKRIDEILAAKYGARKFKSGKDPLTELIFTILSQNTSDTNRDRAFASLKRAYPTWEQTAKATPAALEKTIRVGGLAKTKAARILKILKALKNNGSGLSLAFLAHQPDEQVKEYLMDMDGVGPKTIACVMAFSLGREVMPVDTHVNRVSTRLGIMPEGLSDTAAHEYFLQFAGEVSLYQLHLNLITHGRTTCRARRPLCDQCDLKIRCDYYREAKKAGKEAA